MSALKLFVAAALVIPAAALAQVGPNPAVQGSLDPTVGSGTDAATAPADVGVGTNATVRGSDAPVTDNDVADHANANASANSSATVETGTEPKRSAPPATESKTKPRR